MKIEPRSKARWHDIGVKFGFMIGGCFVLGLFELLRGSAWCLGYFLPAAALFALSLANQRYLIPYEDDEQQEKNQ